MTRSSCIGARYLITTHLSAGSATNRLKTVSLGQYHNIAYIDSLQSDAGQPAVMREPKGCGHNPTIKLKRDDKKLPTIGEVIKEYRLKAGLSQQQLGEKLGLASVARQRVAQWENGYRTPASEHLLKLMAVLNIPPEAFDEYKNNI